jgi:hypothetical protein
MSDLIGSDHPLSEAGRNLLRVLAGAIIPASPAHGLPGADDPEIFEDLLRSAGPALGFIGEHLPSLDRLAGPGGFSAGDLGERVSLAEQFRASHPEAAGLIVSLICQCYYRDPRVLESLGTPPRPPFPEGYEVTQGDWSLLDPVKARGPIYRA